MDSLGSRSHMRDASPTPDPVDRAPRRSSKSSRKRDMDEMQEVTTNLAPSSSLGQFSFAPATRTTIVTTTTTTTTDFPPLILNPPRSARHLDPKQYPLAANPTPVELRRFQFELGGQSVIFNEPDDASAALNELNEQRDALRASKGVLTSVAVYDGPNQNATSSRAPINQASQVTSSRRRSVSPFSKRESSHQTGFLGTVREPRAPILSRRSRLGRVASASNSSALGLATPETEANQFRLDHHAVLRKRIHGDKLGYRVNTSSSKDDPDALQTSNPRPPLFSRASSQMHDKSDTTVSPLRNSQDSQSAPDGLDTEETMMEENETGQYPESSTDQPHRNILSGPNLPTIDSALGQDMCLPSPSLSPVTAMNTHNPDFEFAEDQGTETDSSLDNQASRFSRIPAQHGTSNVSTPGEVYDNSAVQSRPPSLMEIPATLDFFESIPDEMKTYVMYQLLRRCPKSTLQFVSDVVNPALKCDFLALLPAELTLNIVRYLDVKSMCRAAQVSKKWRHIINSDERAWKELFDGEGFKLPPGELQRAIREGWGWQFPNGSDDWEKDLSGSVTKVDTETLLIDQPSSSASVDTASVGSSSSRRPKRKAPSNRTASRKLARRKLTSSHEVDSAPASYDWTGEATLLEGPYAAATAAAAAVPFPDVGLSSLRSVHLYKSLYQRHSKIRKTWMRADPMPKHLAFRAHERHVVTCLQFDSEKILTGSDDTKIHVYDTKTGALKSILSGHEGGVWALEYYGNTLVSGSTDRSVRVWDIEKAKCTQVFHGHTSTVRCLQILLPTEIGKNAEGSAEMMPKEPLIITGSRDSNLRVWKLPKPTDPVYLDAGPHANDTDCPYFLRTLSGHQHSVRAIAAHGDTLVSGSYDCTVRVWKISTGESLFKLQGHTLKVYSVVLDVERNRCISGSMDQMVKIWSLENGTCLHTLEGHSSLVGLLDLKSDRLVSAAADSTLRIWDPENGQCKSTLTAHTGAITCFQHDGEKVISGSDRTLKMWNVRTGECVKDLLKDLSGVWQVRFDDRRCVAAVQRDGVTYIEVLDFGAFRDGFPDYRLGQRIVVNRQGVEVNDDDEDDYDATE